MPRTLYELAEVESPFVWRTKYALAHKGLPYETVRIGFTQIPIKFEDRQTTLPVLEDNDGTEIGDSMDIAVYLDETYPEGSTVLGEGYRRARQMEGMINSLAFPAFFPLYIHDIWTRLSGADADYFRKTREKRFGASLEEISADRDARLPEAREKLQPLRDEITKSAWLAGNGPGYADFVVLAFFAWIKAAASAPPLETGDPIAQYVSRGFALYGGIGEQVSGGPLTKPESAT